MEFELKNSHFPMIVLHDIYLKHSDLSAQIDYIVITPKVWFILECKNLYGDIEITSNDDFIRTMEYNGKVVTEGIYSPIVQINHHLELLKQIRISNKKTFKRFIIDNTFDYFHNPIIVLANPKSILNAKKARKEIREKVIRSDQLINHIKDKNKKSIEFAFTKKEALEMAELYLSFHSESDVNYTEKYKRYRIPKHAKSSAEISSKTVNTNNIQIEETSIYKELKHYRLIKSREESIKAYLIFNNSQLIDIISKMPSNKRELLEVNGFGEKKTEKYGDDILAIVNKY